MINFQGSGLPIGWSQCGFNNISDVVMGQSPPSSTYNKSGEGLPFFQGKAEFQDLYPSIEKYCSEPNKIAQKGAVLMSVRAPVGPTNIAPEKCCIGRGLAAFHPLGGISTSYLIYLLRSIERKLAKEGTGTTFSAINKQYIEGVRFGLPPLNEQHRIVAKIEELFSELDKGIESLKTAREQLKVYRQALLKHAFEGKLTEQWRKENADKLETADQLLGRIKKERETRYQQQLEAWKVAVKQWEADGREGKKPAKPRKYTPTALDDKIKNDLEEIPSGWIWINFSELLYSIRGGTTTPPIDETTNYPILRSSSVRSGIIEFYDIRYLKKEGIKTDQDFVAPGDLLFSRLNGTIDYVGNCAVVKSGYPDNLLYPDRLYCAKLVDTSLAPYCEYFFSSPAVRRHIEEKAKSTAGHKRISIPDITDLKFKVAGIAEMEVIVSILDSQISVIQKHQGDIENNILKAETLRQSILKNAFSGELVPQDPNDEPASILLERIAEEKAETAAKAKKAKVTNKKQVTRKAS